MSIATICTCGKSLSGFCNSWVKECTQLIKNEPQQNNMSHKKYTEQDVRNIISMVCDHFNQAFVGREEFINKTIKTYARALHPSESAGVNDPGIAVYELKIVLHRLLKSFKGVAISDLDKKRYEDAERILNKYSSIKDVLRSETGAAGASAVWVKGQYDQLWEQIHSGIRTVCYVDYHWDRTENANVLRDICTIRKDHLEFSARGIGYGGVAYVERDLKQEFLEECERLNVEWLCESASPAQSGKEDVVAFAEWLWNNRWYHFENGKWFYTFEMGTAMSDKSYQKNYVKTTAQLYDIYKNQNK